MGRRRKIVNPNTLIEIGRQARDARHDIQRANKRLGEAMRAYRVARQMTANDLAALLGISASMVYAIETGRKGLGPAWTAKLAGLPPVEIQEVDS